MPAARDIVTEIYVGGRWVDISGYVYERAPVTITRGRPDEASKPERSKCTLTVNNRSGDLSPRNPTGQWYGSLGRNTPLRLGIRPGVADTFARTVSNGWGSTDTGQAWSTTGAGGSVLASDFTVSGGVGTHSVPTTVAYRLTYLSAVSYRDVDVRVDVTLPFSDVTGGDVEPANILLRGQSTTNYYMARVVVNSSEAVTVALMHYDGTVLAAAVTVSGLTHSSSQALRVRAQCEGQTVRAKVWAASGSEPYGWHVAAHNTTITSAGWVGVRSGVASGNTNTKPIVFSYDNFTATIPRFAGEVVSWPQRWDLSGNDRYVPIETAGIMRRLGQGSSALHSSLRRGLVRASDPPVAYWPCEDGRNSTQIASGINSVPMVVTGSPQFASNDDFDCSASLPELNLSVWTGFIPAYTPGTGSQLRFLFSLPSGGVAAESPIVMITGSGSIRWWILSVDVSGNLALRAYNASGTAVYDSGFWAFDMKGKPAQLSVDFTQVGANVDATFAGLLPGFSTGAFVTNTINSQTCGIMNTVIVNPYAMLDDVAVGHFSVHRNIESIFAVFRQLSAWIGETAGDRLARICGEEGIAFSHVGALSDTAPMGAQRPGKLLDLLAECADADLGSLYEPRGEIGLSYRTRTSLYNQDATLALDYSAGQVSPPFEPLPDDQLVRNDITAKRTDGSEARAVLETGRMSVLDPADGGAGRYDTSTEVNVELDSQLRDVAGWLLNLGTVDEERYPSITVDLTTPGVVSAGLEPQALALDVGDRLTVDNLPAGQPPDLVSQLALGFTETINLFLHKVASNCAPASPWQVIVLDDDATAKLGSDASSLAEDLTSAETGIDVAISDGTLWTTDAGEMPIALMVGGEEISVTAISGASSPQTFTATRSVNGVSKSQSTGEEISLARPAALAI